MARSKQQTDMLFYTKIIKIESVIEQLHNLDLSDEERIHLANLVDSSLHHIILNEVLTNLNDDDKRTFLKLLHQDPESEQLMEFLQEKIENIEEKIKKVSEELVLQMHKDIKEAKNIKKHKENKGKK